MGKSHIRWLYGQLDGWVETGILSADVAAKLRKTYGPVEMMTGRRVMLMICSVLGGVLVGGGLLLVLGHNWTGMPRPVRTVMSLLPLVTGQIVLVWGTMTGRQSAAWREGITGFMALSVGAAIALVGQTYHLPGDMAAFLLTWALLILPLAYLVRASLPALLYMALVLSWAGHIQWHGGHVLLFWPLAGLIVPYVWKTSSKQPFSNRNSILGWSSCIALSIGAGLSLEKCVPGLWIMIYASLFACMYLVGRYWFRRGENAWQCPWQNFGATGTAILTLILTFEDVWDEVGWSYYHYGGRYWHEAGWVDYILLLALPCAALLLLVMAARRKQLSVMLYGVLPVVASAGFIYALLGMEWAAMLLFNAYALVLGIGTIVLGVGRGHVGAVNGGMLILSALVVLRFFDVDLGFLARGIVFIALGVGFLITNVVLAKCWKKGEEQND